MLACDICDWLGLTVKANGENIKHRGVCRDADIKAALIEMYLAKKNIDATKQGFIWKEGIELQNSAAVRAKYNKGELRIQLAKPAVSIDSTAVSANAISEVPVDSDERSAMLDRLEAALADQDDSIVSELLNQVEEGLKSANEGTKKEE